MVNVLMDHALRLSDLVEGNAYYATNIRRIVFVRSIDIMNCAAKCITEGDDVVGTVTREIVVPEEYLRELTCQPAYHFNQKVSIVDDDTLREVQDRHEHPGVTEEMFEYCGAETEITAINISDSIDVPFTYYVNADGYNFMWSEAMLVPWVAEEPIVIEDEDFDKLLR